MFNLQQASAIITFLLGDIDRFLLTALALVGANFAISMILHKTSRKELVIYHFKKLLAYLLLVMVAVRLDELVINMVFDWKGSSHLLMCLYIIARELRPVLDGIGKLGVPVPKFLDTRIRDMEEGNAKPRYDYGDPKMIDERIRYLQENMERIRELKRLEHEMNNFTDPKPRPEDPPPSPAPAQQNPKWDYSVPDAGS